RLGRLHQRAAARHAQPVDDRERHPVEVPRADRLSGSRRTVLHPDGHDPGARRPLRARPRDGEADRMTAGAEAIAVPRGRGVPAAAFAFLGRNAPMAYAVIALGYLLLPCAA